LLAALSRDAGDAARIRLAVGPLEPAHALDVALELFRAAGSPADLAGAVALESCGNPFFLHELVRYISSDARREIPSLDAVIGARVDRLGETARRLVELVAVAGRPIEQRLARNAARIADADWPALIQLVGAARLVRVSGRRDSDVIECYHDRIRETLTARLAPDQLATHHHALGQALQESYRRDPETISQHLEAAGDRARAAHFAMQAADMAAAALAFDRAAALYRRTLELGGDGNADDTAIRLKLASALVNAGRGGDAARIYLDAAARHDAMPAVRVPGGALTRPDGHALELRRLAAEQLLRSGHVDEGLATLDTVLASIGLSVPRSPMRAVPSLLWQRFRLRLRGFEPAPEQPVRLDRVMTMEICRTANIGLALFDPVRSAPFATRHLRMALDSGDRFRISFALGIEAALMASARDPSRANALCERAESLARELDHPFLIGCVGLVRAVMAHERGEYRESFEHCERTEELVTAHLTGISWELCTLQMFSLHSLFFLGEFGLVFERTERYVADARERGDLYAIMNMRSLSGACTHVVLSDDPDAARAEIADVESQFPGSGFYVQHMFLLYAKTFVDLYDGEPRRAFDRLMASRGAVRGSLLLHDRAVHMFWHFLVAGSALGSAARDPSSAPRFLRRALRCARTLERDGAPTFLAFARQIRATVAALRGDAATAIAQLETSIQHYDHRGMKMFAAAARRRVAQLRGDGAAIAAIDQLLRGNLVKDPVRGARCLSPGFPD
jgi:hypothetical protein